MQAISIENFALPIVRRFATESSSRNAHWQSFAISAWRFSDRVVCFSTRDRDVSELFSEATWSPPCAVFQSLISALIWLYVRAEKTGLSSLFK